MAKYSVEAGCTSCRDCFYVCPVSAISMDMGGAQIDSSICIGCGSCAMNCSSGAIVRIEG